MRGRLLNHALAMLLWDRLRGAVQLGRLFAEPRRAALWVLAAVWLLQTAWCARWRAPMPADQLHASILLSFSLYCIWHCLASVTVAPDPYRWSPAERAQLLTAPFSRHEVLLYRLATRAPTAMGKGFVVSMLLQPDLGGSFLLACVGFTLAFLTLDVLRMAMECFQCGLNMSGRRLSQALAYSTAGALVAIATMRSWDTTTLVSLQWQVVGLDHVVHLTRAIADWHSESWVGWIVVAPWHPVAHLVVGVEGAWCGHLLRSIVVLASATCVLCLVDKWSKAEADDIWSTSLTCGHRVQRRLSQRWDNPFPSCRGGAEIAWIQVLSVVQHMGVVLTALTITACLTWLPIISGNGHFTIFKVLGGLFLYSFVLLPAVLKFDFRRNTERLGALKRLPINPRVVTAGQLAVPVTMALGFQTLVLGVALPSLSIPLWIALLAIVSLLPLNVLIFAAENWVYLLYPQQSDRRDELMLRTVLTFTAKGLVMFVMAIVALSLLVITHGLSRRFAMPLSAPALFGAGCWMFVTWGAWLMTCRLTTTFEDFEAAA